MLLTYADESYTAGHYYIAALVVPEHEAQALASALDEVAAKAARDHGVPRGNELHGHELINGKGQWNATDRAVRSAGPDRARTSSGEHLRRQ